MRKAVQLFDNDDVPDYLNPYKVIKSYQSLLPEGWADQIEARPLFLKPLKKIANGVGYSRSPRGRNFTANYLKRAMARIGKKGYYTNTQARAAFINGALETGMRDNEIRSVTGHRSETALNSYKNHSMSFLKSSRKRMLSSLMDGNHSWHGSSDSQQIQLYNKPQTDLSISGQNTIMPISGAQQRNVLMKKALCPGDSVTDDASDNRPKKNKHLFGKKWKEYQEEVTRKELYELSTRNQSLLSLMLKTKIIS